MNDDVVLKPHLSLWFELPVNEDDPRCLFASSTKADG